MKTTLALLVLSVLCLAQSVEAQTRPAADAAPDGFVFKHPGLLDSKAELDAVKAAIKAGADPWASEYRAMKSSRYGDLSWTPHPVVVVHANGQEAWREQDDAVAAYTLALLWYYSGEEAYGAKSAEILNAWATTLKEHTSTDRQKEIVAAWAGSVFPLAAEILRSSYPGWTVLDTQRFSAMLDRAFVPLLAAGNATYNGNWELSMANALVCIGVFNEDDAAFRRGVLLWRQRVPAYFYISGDGLTPIRPSGTKDRDSDRAINDYWFAPIRYVDGLCQETGRDFGHHMQMGLASAINTAEVAFHQGLDLYAEQDARLMATMEFHAARLLGHPLAGPELFARPFAASGVLPTWEIAYHHFHGRKRQAMPLTAELIRTKVHMAEPRTMLNMAWERLTHTGPPLAKPE